MKMEKLKLLETWWTVSLSYKSLHQWLGYEEYRFTVYGIA